MLMDGKIESKREKKSLDKHYPLACGSPIFSPGHPAFPSVPRHDSQLAMDAFASGARRASTFRN